MDNRRSEERGRFALILAWRIDDVDDQRFTRQALFHPFTGGEIDPGVSRQRDDVFTRERSAATRIWPTVPVALATAIDIGVVGMVTFAGSPLVSRN